MCAVTYIPAGEDFFITSNRDENPCRAGARAPGIVEGPSGRLLFPRDGQAGGTWFVLHEKGHVLVLLNGAWKKHVPQPPYRKSRGLILLEWAQNDHPLSYFQMMDLKGIEPFTVILVEEGSLYECRWDGSVKYDRQLDRDIPHIWSSAPLYDEDVARLREKRFEEWLKETCYPDQEAILKFHQSPGSRSSGAGAGDPNRRGGLFIEHEDGKGGEEGKEGKEGEKGDDGVCTVSITSLQYTPQKASLRYLAIPGRQPAGQELFFTKAGMFTL